MTAKTKKHHYKRKDNIAGYLFLSPWIFGFMLMWLVPAAISIYYSFTDFNLLNVPSIIGLSNYKRIFTQDDTFLQALKVTFTYVLYLYRRAFTYFDMGYSCALAWVLVAIIAVFTVILFKTQNNWVHYES